jgi:hypothetical protein
MVKGSTDIRGFSQWALEVSRTPQEIARLQRSLELQLFLGFRGTGRMPDWYKPLGDGVLALWIELDRMKQSANWLIPKLSIFWNDFPNSFPKIDDEDESDEYQQILSLNKFPRNIGVTFSLGEIVRYKRINMNSSESSQPDYDYAGRPIILATKYQQELKPQNKIIADKEAYNLLSSSKNWKIIKPLLSSELFEIGL